MSLCAKPAARPVRPGRLLEQLEPRLMYNAVPVAVVDLPDQAAANTQTEFTVTLENASAQTTEVGYGPYVDIEAPRGVLLATASQAGSPLSLQLVGEFNANGELVYPVINLPRNHPLTGQPVTGGTPGSRLYTVQLPATSLSPSDAPVTITVEALISRGDGATGDSPLLLWARGGFAQGSDPADNPQADPAIVGNRGGDLMHISGALDTVPLDQQQLNEASFQLVWQRLTPQEVLAILGDRNYLSRLPDDVPSHLKAAGVLDWLWYDKPLADGTLQYDPDTDTFSGTVLSREPWRVAAALESAFVADRAGFLSRYLTADRINELTNQQSTTDTSAGLALTRGISWLNTGENLSNLVATVNVAYRNDRQELNKTPAQLKFYTDAQPAGDRIVRSMGFEYLPTWSNGKVNLGYYDNEVLNQDFAQPGLWTDAWRQQIEVIWDNYWSQYQALGGQIDWLVFDMERTPLLYDVEFEDPSYVAQVVGDPRFAALAEKLGWQDDPLGNFQAALGAYETDPRAFMFHELLHAMRADDLNFLVSIVQRYFPDVKAFDYNHAAKAPGTFSAGGSGKYYLTPLGTGSVVGTHSSMPLYGELRDTWMWSQAGGTNVAPTFGAPGPSYPLPPDEQTNWNAFSYNLMRIRSSVAASTAPIVTWLSYKDFNNPDVSQLYSSSPDSNLLYNSDLWYELIFHAELSGAEIMYWNRNGSFNDLPMSQAISEVDGVLKYSGMQVMPGERVEWNDPYLATRADVGGRIVWRVTPDPTRPYTIITEGNTLVFDFGANGRLEIPRGQIVPLANQVSSAGFWVYQANSIDQYQLWTQQQPSITPTLPGLIDPDAPAPPAGGGTILPVPQPSAPGSQVGNLPRPSGGGQAAGGSSAAPSSAPATPLRFAYDSFQLASLSGWIGAWRGPNLGLGDGSLRASEPAVGVPRPLEAAPQGVREVIHPAIVTRTPVATQLDARAAVSLAPTSYRALHDSLSSLRELSWLSQQQRRSESPVQPAAVGQGALATAMQLSQRHLDRAVDRLLSEGMLAHVESLLDEELARDPGHQDRESQGRAATHSPEEAGSPAASKAQRRQFELRTPPLDGTWQPLSLEQAPAAGLMAADTTGKGGSSSSQPEAASEAEPGEPEPEAPVQLAGPAGD